MTLSGSVVPRQRYRTSMSSSVSNLRERASSAGPWPAPFPSPDTFRRQRRLLDLTQEEAAELLGVTRVTVSRYEAGATGVPTSLLAEWPLRVLAVMAEEAGRLAMEVPSK